MLTHRFATVVACICGAALTAGPVGASSFAHYYLPTSTGLTLLGTRAGITTPLSGTWSVPAHCVVMRSRDEMATVERIAVVHRPTGI